MGAKIISSTTTSQLQRAPSSTDHHHGALQLLFRKAPPRSYLKQELGGAIAVVAGLCRSIVHGETIDRCPPDVRLHGRKGGRNIAASSRNDAPLPFPLFPTILVEVVGKSAASSSPEARCPCPKQEAAAAVRRRPGGDEKTTTTAAAASSTCSLQGPSSSSGCFDLGNTSSSASSQEECPEHCCSQRSAYGRRSDRCLVGR